MHFRDRVFNLRISVCNVSLANSVDPDQTEQSDLVQHCLSLCLKVISFWVNISCLKKTKKDSESSYKAMSECQKIPVRSAAVVPVVSLFESYS